MAGSTRVVLDADASSAAVARAHVDRLMGDSPTVEQHEDAAVVVSELVTNAVLYGREPIWLAVEVEARSVRVQVLDSGAGYEHIAHPCFAERRAPGGRGLVIVDALARRWGVTAVAGGTCVWATVALSA